MGDFICCFFLVHDIYDTKKRQYINSKYTKMYFRFYANFTMFKNFVLRALSNCSSRRFSFRKILRWNITVYLATSIKHTNSKHDIYYYVNFEFDKNTGNLLRLWLKRLCGLFNKVNKRKAKMNTVYQWSSVYRNIKNFSRQRKISFLSLLLFNINS